MVRRKRKSLFVFEMLVTVWGEKFSSSFFWKSFSFCLRTSLKFSKTELDYQSFSKSPKESKQESREIFSFHFYKFSVLKNLQRFTPTKSITMMANEHLLRKFLKWSSSKFLSMLTWELLTQWTIESLEIILYTMFDPHIIKQTHLVTRILYSIIQISARILWKSSPHDAKRSQ